MLAKALSHRWIALATLLVMGALAVGLFFGIGPNHQVSAQQPPCDTTKAGGDCLDVQKGAQSMIGQPVPSSVIVSASGLEWVWASPCALNGCTSGIDVGHDGFNFATVAQWALFPFNSFTGGSGNTGTPCASPWFDLTHNHCDRVNLVPTPGFTQTYGSAPTGGTPAVLNGAPGVMLSFSETFLVRTADPHPQLEAKLDRLEPKLDKLEAKLDQRIEPKLDRIMGGIGALEAKLDRRIEPKLDGIGQGIAQLEGKIDKGVMPSIGALEAKLDRRIEPKLDGIGKGIGALEAKLDQRVEPKLDKLEAKLDQLEAKLDQRIEPKLDKLEGKLDKLEAKLDRRIEPKLDKLEAKAEKLQMTVDELFKFVKCLPSSRSVVPPQERQALGCPPG